MYPPVQSDEETWYYIQVFTVTAVITNLFFYLFLYLLWDAAFLQHVSEKTKMQIMATSHSYIHGVVASLLATWALISEKELHEDYVWGKSELASTTCAITAGYMAGDLIIILTYWKQLGDWQFVIHHLTSIGAFIYVCLVGSYRFFAMIRLLAEHSTLFVNNRAVFHQLGMQHGSAYFYNGLLMVFSFTIARIAPFPFYLYCIYSVTGTEGYNKSGLGKYIMWSSTLFLDSLNIMWYHRMIKGGLKVWNSHKVAATTNGESRSKEVKQG